MTIKAIETQEQLDAIIKDRVERAKESARKELESQYADYDDLKKKAEESDKADTVKDKRISELEALVKGADAEKEGLTAKIKGLAHEKLKVSVAQAVGLPYEMANRLTGDDEEALTADAEKLKSFVGGKSAPLAGYDNNKAEPDRRNALKGMLKGMQE